MSRAAYDIVAVGGGLGGSALAATVAKRGARVLVLEREECFSDRVRGEVLAPWGVGDLRALGLLDLVRSRCGHELAWFDLFYAGVQVARRDVPATTPQGAPWLAFYHPAMQEAVLGAAVAAGAEVRRGVRVESVTPGPAPTVRVEGPTGSQEVSARLVVGADGRGSLVRRWGGFEVRRDEPRHLFSGLLLDGMSAPADASSMFLDSSRGRISLLFPQGGGRVRAYVGYHRAGGPPRAGEYEWRRFVEESIRVGVPAAWYAGTSPAGPLAMFDATDVWVDHPYHSGVALIGDAANMSDPTWGQGMSLTLRDIRTLADCLAANDDWDAAGHAYAAAHDVYAGAVRTADEWYAQLFLQPGALADERRAVALPLIAADPERMVDVPASGPEVPVDEQARRRFFGEI